MRFGLKYDKNGWQVAKNRSELFEKKCYKGFILCNSRNGLLGVVNGWLSL